MRSIKKIPKKYGENIKKLRIDLNLNRAEFARALEISYTSITHYEEGLGQPAYPIARKMLELAKKEGLNIKLQDLRSID